jgi:hypothetical protein
LAHDEIVVAVGPDLKPVVGESLRRLDRLDDVGQQGLFVADHFELHQWCFEGFSSELRGRHGVASAEAAGRIGQEANTESDEEVVDRAFD